MLRRQISEDQARDRIERLCAKCERCTYDMRRKLLGWGIEDRKAAGIIAALVEERFIDDARFAKAYTRDKYRFQRWGRRRISNELRMRHIAPAVIEEALCEIDEAEYRGIALELLRAKARSLYEEADTFEGRRKLLRFGMSRGYEPDMLISMIKSGLQPDTEGPDTDDREVDNG